MRSLFRERMRNFARAKRKIAAEETVKSLNGAFVLTFDSSVRGIFSFCLQLTWTLQRKLNGGARGTFVHRRCGANVILNCAKINSKIGCRAAPCRDVDASVEKRIFNLNDDSIKFKLISGELRAARTRTRRERRITRLARIWDLRKFPSVLIASRIFPYSRVPPTRH